MFISSESYFRKIENIFDTSKTLCIAVAFWGKGAEKIIKNWKGNNIKIICNLFSGGTNPYVIEEISKNKNIEIKHNNKLHAKVIISDNSLIIGSANISANGLGYEDTELNQWQEAGYIVTTPYDIIQCQNWFNSLWNESASCTNSDIKHARKIWERNRFYRQVNPIKNELSTLSNEVLEDKIYLAVYQEEASQEAQKLFKKIKKENSKVLNDRLELLDYFDDWSDRYKEPLPKDAYIIPVYCSEDGEFYFNDMVKRLPSLDETYKPHNGKRTTLIILEKIKKAKELGNISINKIQLEKLKLRVENNLRIFLKNPKKLHRARCINISDVL